MLFRLGWNCEVRTAEVAPAIDPRPTVVYLHLLGIDDQIIVTTRGEGPRLAGCQSTRLNHRTENSAEITSSNAPKPTKTAVTSVARVRSMTMRALRCS